MTDKSLANPLQAIIDQAAKTSTVTGATSVYRERLDRAGNCRVVLADTSGSMNELANGGRKKIELLREALDQVVTDERVILFSDLPGEVHRLDIAAVEATGGTRLDLALELAAGMRPRHTLVISDGQPNDQASALASAQRLSGIIDVLYIGPETDYEAIAFMRRLAGVGGGSAVVHDVGQHTQLGPAIRGLLGPVR